MNDLVSADAPTNGKTPEELAGLKNIVLVVYALQALSFLWGVTAIVGIVIDYVKREDAVGTIYQSHFDWQIRSFWWALLWLVVGMVLIFVGIGLVVLFVAWVWMIYRVVKGWLKLNEGKPVFPA